MNTGIIENKHTPKRENCTNLLHSFENPIHVQSVMAIDCDAVATQMVLKNAHQLFPTYLATENLEIKFYLNELVCTNEWCL